MANHTRSKWPGNVRSNILRSLEAARKRGIRGELTAIYLKYGITPQHEVQWRKAKKLTTAIQTEA